jgi:hypothetical protein
VVGVKEKVRDKDNLQRKNKKIKNEETKTEMRERRWKKGETRDCKKRK